MHPYVRFIALMIVKRLKESACVFYAEKCAESD